MNKEQSFGKALKQLRESNNIKLDQISSFTKINKKSLEKLEGGDFSFKSEVYIKLFLKEYIKFVDFENSDSILNEFNKVLNKNHVNIALPFIPTSSDNDSNNQKGDKNSFEPPSYDPKKIGTIIITIIRLRIQITLSTSYYVYIF